MFAKLDDRRRVRFEIDIIIIQRLRFLTQFSCLFLHSLEAGRSRLPVRQNQLRDSGRSSHHAIRHNLRTQGHRRAPATCWPFRPSDTR